VIILTCVNFISIKLSTTIKNRIKTIEKKPIKKDVPNNVDPRKKASKRPVERPKNVKINEIDRIIP
jgi:hypothetical protein